MDIKQVISQITRRLGYVIVKSKTPDLILQECYPPGHFYSVIPSLSEVMRASATFSNTSAIHSIELNTKKQIQMLKDFKMMREESPFYSRDRRIRFNIENPTFSYDDAPILHYMMRRLKPKRIIEIGSGNSSACMLDTNEIYLGDSPVEFTFIDVNCENLRRNLLDTDYEKIQILEKSIQEIDLKIFSTLEENDILFIDSSHVIKSGSDLHTIFFEVLPILSPGVCIHFHDVRYPFQYQKEMAMGGSFWNEAYLLRAFLMYNKSFEIVFWLNYLVNIDLPEVNNLLRFLPLAEWDKKFNKSSGEFSGAGGSIYITKRL